MSEQVCAIVVTYNRNELLKECLIALKNQTRKPDHILVVDNASTDGTFEMVKEQFPDVDIFRLPENQGGAGGFHEGMKWAYEMGYDWLWLMDDDGVPNYDCLEKLEYASKEYGLMVVSPLVVEKNNPSRLAFSLIDRGRRILEACEIYDSHMIEGYVNLFNGVLIKSDCISKVGLPNKKLFIRGDEVDYFLRLSGMNISMATVCFATFFHPSGIGEEKALFKDRLVVNYTGIQFKDYYMYRNRGYIIRKYRGFIYVLLEFLRYGLFFLFVRKFDLKGMVFWFKAFWSGFTRVSELESNGDGI